MAESRSDVERDMEQTRERMSGTVRHLEEQISARVDAVQEKVDVARMAREHPWIAAGIAFGTGLAVSLTKADGKIADAVASGVTAAASAVSDAARRAAESTTDAVESVKDRLAGSDDQSRSAGERDPERPGFVDRIKDRVADALEGPADTLLDEMRAASIEVAYPRDTVLPPTTPEPSNAEPSSWGAEPR